MPKLENGEDPLIVAALIDDDDDEESKEITKNYLDQADSSDDDEEIPAGTTDDEGDDPDESEEDDDTADPDKQKPADESDDDEEKPEVKTPPEAIDAGGEDDQPKGDDTEKKSRAERRAERRRKYIERLTASPQNNNQKLRDELLQDEYKPLDIQQGEYEADDLIKDRSAAQQAAYIRGVEQQRKIQEEASFWDTVDNEAASLKNDPKYDFLDEKSDAFGDGAKAEYVNNLYLQTIGFENHLARDSKGLPIIGRDGEPMYAPTVRRKDLGYKEFVEGFVEHMMDFDQDNEAEITKGIVQQRAQQGVRPGGSTRRGLGKLHQGDISKMSDEEFEKHEAEIDRQINAELGIS